MPRTLDLASYKWLIGELKRTREETGVTQSVLADALGRPQSFVAKIENLDRKLDVIEYMQICNALRIDAGNLSKRLAIRLKRQS